jgi:hypothetical protein
VLPHLVLGISRFATAASPTTVSAECGEGTGILPCDTGLPRVGAGTPQIQQVLSITFGIIAALAVLMIVIAGFRFIIGQGSAQETAKARNTIVYALAGLIVSLMAEAIVALVLGKS